MQSFTLTIVFFTLHNPPYFTHTTNNLYFLLISFLILAVSLFIQHTNTRCRHVSVTNSMIFIC